MGLYINPGDENFRQLRNGRYVDKSGLIGVINKTIDQPERLSCISRPRRFGKSYAAAMLASYYCTGCDSSELFDDLEIAQSPDYRKYMNQYNVLLLDITGFIGGYGLGGMLQGINDTLYREASRQFSELPETGDVSSLLSAIVDMTGRKFIAVIDEWDSPIRDERSTPEIQHNYLEFLRSLFKNTSVTNKTFAAAYMTGILPIKKDGSQSAISEFNEYTIIKPWGFAPYVGFTEEEVRSLCEEYDSDYNEMKRWYDGYSLAGVGSVYNPNSVMKALRNRSFESYWEMSSSASSLIGYINMDYEGLSEITQQLLSDRPISIDPSGFENDPRSVKCRDDVLTLLVYYGYLNYDPESGLARIPNEEIRQEFARAVRRITHPDTIRRVQESDKLIQDVVYMRSDEVAAAIEKIHREEFEPRHYNNEQSLRSVIKLAFFAYKDKFTQLEELASGDGYADIVYLPKKGIDMPIMVIELKWNRSAETALDQIRRKHYPDVLEGRDEQILLVGISYDKDDPEKKHSCVIEELCN